MRKTTEQEKEKLIENADEVIAILDELGGDYGHMDAPSRARKLFTRITGRKVHGDEGQYDDEEGDE